VLSARAGFVSEHAHNIMNGRTRLAPACPRSL
jgi:hypothetical protein